MSTITCEVNTHCNRTHSRRSSYANSLVRKSLNQKREEIYPRAGNFPVSVEGGVVGAVAAMPVRVTLGAVLVVLAVVLDLVDVVTVLIVVVGAVVFVETVEVLLCVVDALDEVCRH